MCIWLKPTTLKRTINNNKKYEKTQEVQDFLTLYEKYIFYKLFRKQTNK